MSDPSSGITLSLPKTIGWSVVITIIVGFSSLITAGISYKMSVDNQVFNMQRDYDQLRERVTTQAASIAALNDAVDDIATDMRIMTNQLTNLNERLRDEGVFSSGRTVQPNGGGQQ